MTANELKHDARRVATILFALRMMQATMDEEKPQFGLADEHGFFGEHEPLDPDEIDDLCEHLNTDELRIVWTNDTPSPKAKVPAKPKRTPKKKS